MEKEFIPYEQALALKELGFDETCLMYWNDFGKTSINRFQLLNKIDEWCQDYIEVPLYQQAFRWFREKYGYFTSPTESDDDTTKKYDWVITKNLGGGKKFIGFVGYKNTYEEAELECLKKLIEIVKEKK
jgi:hypothetical protein